MSDGVARDGSPVEVYLALPAGETPGLIDAAIGPNQSILELGSGPGRITHELVGLGHEVVAVDDSPEMLEHIVGAEAVLADVFTFELERAFDVVLAASHFINDVDEERRRALLEVCRKHVADDGTVLIERYPPDWATDPKPGDSHVGEVRVVFEPLEIGDGTFSGRAIYEVDGGRWIQEFSAATVTDSMLEEEASNVGLKLVGFLDRARSWARLEVAR